MNRLLTNPWPAHLIAMSATLYFAWHVAQTGFASSAVQFITPLLVMMGVHFLVLWAQRALQQGFALTIYRRSLGTSVLLAAFLLGGSILAPQPAAAQGSDIAATILTVVFCVLVIAVIVGIAAGIVYLFAKLAFWAIGPKEDDDDPDSRLNDVASLAITVLALGAASIEGVAPHLNFNPDNTQSVTLTVNAPTETVWATMQTATSPDFPLPAILASFPQPTNVKVDEGTDLGSNRVVTFAGREGAGALRLQVVERTDTAAIFEVLKDTTPYRRWIGYDKLTYQVVPTGETTKLTVTLDYERKLAPAWFFEPAMAGAAHLAMGVLARDVKARSEAR